MSDRPALALVEMALTMTIPMVACMRFRGHGWRLCNEMAASMLILALGALALLSGGLVTDTAALGIEHIAMLPSMLRSVMIARLSGAVANLARVGRYIPRIVNCRPRRMPFRSLSSNVAV